MDAHAPGFHELEVRSEKNCKNCHHFSHAYDGFCGKFSFKITSDYAICEAFLERGSIYCPFCSSKIQEQSDICPICQTPLNLSDDEIEENNTLGQSNREFLRVQQLPPETIKYSQEFETKFNIWKQYLLDLSKRNFQLNFSPSSKRTIEIISPSQGEIFEKLVGEEKRLHFYPVFHPETLIKGKKSTDLISEDNSELIKTEHEKALFLVLENPPSNELVARLNDKVLEHRASRLLEKNEHFIEEKGVNSLFFCFGLLKWKAKSSEDPIYSPILFIPIRISRVSVKSLHSVEALDENVIINPSLLHKLKLDFNINLPPFTGEYSKARILEFLLNLSTLFESQPTWEITHRTFVSLFSFNKIPLFQDLVSYKQFYYKHPFIRPLAELAPLNQNIDTSTLSEEIANNEEYINVFSVLDVDYSQMQAVSYIEKGYSCVIRGPPGTGKSQCIANIIAESLSNQKKVLFVAQKSAALEVVKARLDKTGIGEFCLELHSDKANKRRVLDQIAHTYNTDLKPFTIPNEKYHTLNRLSTQLDAYVEGINTPYGSNADLIEQKLAALDNLRDVKAFTSQIPKLEQINEDKLIEIEEILGNLESFTDIRQNYSEFPWKFTSFAQPPECSYTDLQDILFEFQKTLDLFMEKLKLFYHKYGFKLIDTPQDLEFIKDFIQQYRLDTLTIDILEIEEKFVDDYGNMGRFLKIPYYHFRKSILRHKITKSRKLLQDHISEIKKIQGKYLVKKHYANDQNLPLMNSELFATNLSELSHLVDQIKLLQNHQLLAKLPFLPGMAGKKDNYWIQQQKWNLFWQKQLQSTFSPWCNFTIQLHRLHDNNLDFLLKEIMDPEAPSNFATRFRKTYLLQWLNRAVHSNSTLYAFRREKYSGMIHHFQDLDANVLKINRYRLAKRLFESRPLAPWLYQDDSDNEIGYLNRELIKRRNIKPLRDIFSISRDYLLTLKPCLLMSPLSIATYLPLENFYQYFDLVIYDEASQICTEDAIGAIVRGKQVVIVGDEKQLPPTRFFTSRLFDEDSGSENDLNSYESVLEESMAIGLPVFTLKNHYRSKRENLIVFSNYHYYDHMLNSFPDVFVDGHDDSVSDQDDSVKNQNTVPPTTHKKAIVFNYIPKGRYDRGKSRTNKIEAEKVARAIIAHYDSTPRTKTGEPRRSLGVITFNEAQMDAIHRTLENLLKQTPEKELRVDFSSYERLFIKNIENVQGNERDVIFFSVGYGYDYEGKYRLNFGALNQQGGERRLNVAITRARYRMEIFCSFLPHEIDFKRSKSKGLRHLFGFLQFAYTNTLSFSQTGALLQSSLDLHSDLQKSIASQLQKKGFQVDLGVGKSKNQIDLGIIHPFDPKRYILGIVLDHGTYAYAPNTTERVRIRPTIFKLLGWNLYHLYSIEWIENWEQILKEIEEKIYELCTLEKEIHQKTQMLTNSEIPLPSDSTPSTSSPYYPSEPIIESEIETGSGIELETESETESDTIFVFHEKDIVRLSGPARDTVHYRKKLLAIEGVTEYKQKEYDFVYTPDDFHEEINESLILQYVNEIVEAEGPIIFDMLVSRISELFGYKKKATYVKNKLMDLLFSGHQEENKTDYKTEPGFLYPNTEIPFLCRISLHPKEDPRSFTEISEYEINNVIRFVLRNGGKMNREALQKIVMNFFGKRSTAKKSKAHFESALQKLKKQKEIRIVGSTILIR